MEVALTYTATITTTTPQSDTENPIRIQTPKSLSFTNAALKHHHHSPPPVTYKECLKNHAASMGGHVVDGCGEFMSSSTSLTCAACGCHRNFHRREPAESPGSTVQHVLEFEPQHRHHPLPPPYSGSSPDSPSPPPISSCYYPSAPHMLLALSAGLSSPPAGSNPYSRKRFRTKFTENQKEKMQEFAEKIEWRIQRSDEARINDLCEEIGVERGVLKVWMHNNKTSLGKNNNGGEIKLSCNLNDNVISSDRVLNANHPSSSS